MLLRIVLMLLTAYLMGSIPTAVIVSKRVKGVDIRTLGDGNMGARNVFRTLGFRASLVVALADVCKGALVVLAALVACRMPGRQRSGWWRCWGTIFPCSPISRAGRGWRPRWV